MKFIITGILPDSPETWKNGGGRALIYLFNLLSMLGEEAQFDGPITDEDIVIYPDCVHGNPLNAKKIVRYMLYYWNGEQIPPEQCVICYHDIYFDQVAQKYDRELPVQNVVYLPTIEPGLFYKDGEKTIEAVCYIGKQHGSIPKELTCPQISKGTTSRQGFADVLRKTKTVYSLDHHTVVFTEAALCGCETWKVLTDGTFEQVKIENPEQHVMVPERDVAAAERFVGIVKEFFKVDQI